MPGLDDLPTVTLLMPCLNEAKTVGHCVAIGLQALHELGIAGEVLVADNGSADGSTLLAEQAGARVSHVAPRGYGAALRAGIAAARGEFIVMGDCDLSYDFSAASLKPYIDALHDGADLVMGNRFKGGIAAGAMPMLHRLGTPVMTWIVNRMFGTAIGDIHCGLRAFRKQAVLRLGLQSDGMEFASEIFIRAVLAKLVIREVPTTLSPDRRGRKPHLRIFRDSARHTWMWMQLYAGEKTRG